MTHIRRLGMHLAVLFTLFAMMGGAMAERCQRSEQEIRDKSHRLIGRIITKSDCTQEARNAGYRLLGYYIPRRNETRDAGYRLVGKGNILAALIWQDWEKRRRR